MKHIKEKRLLAMIRKEYRTGRNWNKGGRSRYYRMMIDVDDAEIWVDCFLDGNSWKVYHDDAIVRLDPEEYVHTVAENEQAYLAKAKKLLTEHGWKVVLEEEA